MKKITNMPKKVIKSPKVQVLHKTPQDPNLPAVTLDDIQLNKFIAKYIETGVAWIAYKQIHPDVTDESARTLASRLLAKVNNRDIMEQMGLSMPHLLSKITQGMEAKKLYTTQHEAIEMEDWLAQHKFTETALKLNKALTNDHLTQTNVQINFGEEE